MEAGIADGLLRKIDGYMERVRKKQPQIKAHSTAGYAETTARMWVAWWDAGAWKAPQKPWDPAVDGPLEDEAAGGAGD
jgi:hypothetical protein